MTEQPPQEPIMSSELMELADRLDDAEGSYSFVRAVTTEVASALRSFAHDQKPVAWLSRLKDTEEWTSFFPFSEKPNDGGGIYELMPVYTVPQNPPPAAGWEVAVEALEIIAGEKQCLDNLMGHADVAAAALKALRTTPAATKSHTDELCSNISKMAERVRAEFVPDQQKINAFNAAHQPAATKSADAGGGWRSLSEDTSWIDGRDVVLLARDMEVQARYCPGEWSDETPNSPREYSGAVWSCFDDEFQLEIEECSHDQSEWGHDGATHWRPVAALSNPASVAANASAEARLRDLLTDVMSQFRHRGCECTFPSETCCAYAKAEVFLIEHPHASDCEKSHAPNAKTIEAMRELEGDDHASGCDKRGADCGATRCRDLGCFGACKPSDRTADVKGEDIALVLLDGFKAGKAPIQIARALLDVYGMWRR